jgi:hypothetical protein
VVMPLFLFTKLPRSCLLGNSVLYLQSRRSLFLASNISMLPSRTKGSPTPRRTTPRAPRRLVRRLAWELGQRPDPVSFRPSRS